MNSFERNQLLLKIIKDGNDDEQLNRQLLSKYDSSRSDASSFRFFRIILFIIFITIAMYELGYNSQHLIFTLVFISYEFAYFNVLKERDVFKLESDLKRVNYDNIREGYEYISKY